MAAITLNAVGDMFRTGYDAIILPSGSISAEPVPGATLGMLVTGTLQNTMTFLGDFSGETATLTVDGDPWTLSNPAYDSGNDRTNWVITPFEEGFENGTAYSVEITLTGVGGGSIEVELAEFQGDAVAVLPGTSYSAPAGLFANTPAARNDNDAYTVTPATASGQIPADDLANGYMVEVGIEFEDTSNGRVNIKGQFVLTSGTGEFITAKATGYARDTSEDRAYVRVWCFLHNPSAGAEIQFQWKRDTDAPTGGIIFSQMQISPWWYSNIGMYLSTDPNSPGDRTPQTLGNLATIFESDNTAIERVGDQVFLRGDNKTYAIFGGQAWDTLGTTRFARWHGLFIDGTFDDSSKAYTYIRNGSNNHGGEIFSRPVRTTTTDVSVQHGCFSGYQVSPFPADGSDHTTSYTGADPHHPLLILELHDDAEVFHTVGATPQSLAAAGTRVDINVANTTEFIDAAGFAVVNNTEVRSLVAGDIFMGANISAGYASSSGARATINSAFRVNSTELDYSKSGDYGRGNQGTIDTYGWGSNNVGFATVAANDVVGLTAGKILGGEGGPVSTVAGWTGFWGVRVQSLPPPQAGGITGDGDVTLDDALGAGDSDLFIQGSGAGLLDDVLGSGDAVVQIQGDGSGLLDDVLGAGTGTGSVTITGDASVNLDPVLGSGAAQLLLIADGSGTLDDVVGSGDSDLLIQANAAQTLDEVLGTGASTLVLQGDGAGLLDNTTGSGASVVLIQADGAGLLDDVVGFGSSVSSITGDGDGQLEDVLGSGDATMLLTGDASQLLEAVLGSGAADLIISAIGSGQLEEVLGSGSAVMALVGDGDGILDPVLGVGDASLILQGSGAGLLDDVIGAGSGGAPQTIGQGSVTLDPVLGSGTAQLIVQADGAGVLDDVLGTGDAALAISASGSVILAEVLGVGAAQLLVSGDGSATLDDVLGSGTAGSGIIGDGDGLLDEVLGSGAARLLLQAGASGLLDDVIGAGSGGFEIPGNAGDGSVVLDDVLGFGASQILIGSDGSALLDDVLGAGAAQVAISADGSGQLDDILGSGDAFLAVTGVAGAMLDDVLGFGTGIVGFVQVTTPSKRVIQLTNVVTGGRTVVLPKASTTVQLPGASRTVTLIQIEDGRQVQVDGKSRTQQLTK